jgi:phosphoglycerate-specific signal transduction histidine kinase
MQKRAYIFPVLILFLFLGPFCISASYSIQTEETESRVEELSEFHEIIYPIWHTAYPEKDYAALREYVPEVNRLAKNVFNAKLPGILRDKKAKWDEGLEQLKKAVEDYNKAAAGENDQALLDAAEALHAKFELMVRLIRPVLKEIDEFHKVLYVVYHKYLPDKEYANIRSVSDDMILKAEAITKAKLPKRLEAKADEFSSASQELLEASKKLKATCLTENTDLIEKAVESLHTKYQNLEKIFN